MTDSTTCPACGAPADADVRFCGACGAAIGAPVPAEPDESGALAAESELSEQDLIDSIALKGGPKAPAMGAAQAPVAPTGSPAQVGRQGTPLWRAPAPQRATPVQPPPPPVQAAQPQTSGGSAEVQELLGYLSSPGMIAAATTAGIVALACVAFGLVLTALPLGDSSGIRGAGFEGFFGPVLVRATGVLAVPISLSSDEGLTAGGQFMPMITVGGVVALFAYLTVWQAPRLAALSRQAALVWSLVGPVIFAVLMLFVALMGKVPYTDVLVAGEARPNLPLSFFLALLWGTIGVAIGRYLVERRQPGGISAPEPVRRYAGLAAVGLRPLAYALVAGAVIGSVAFVISAFKDISPAYVAQFAEETEFTVDTRLDQRTQPFGAIENVAYAAEHGIHFVSLGLLGRFQGTEKVGNGVIVSTPFPTAEGGKVSAGANYGLFDYSDGLPGALFALLLLLALGVPATFAVLAGFSVARRAGATNAARGALWGAATGPVWALALTFLSAVANKTKEVPTWGYADLGSTLGFSLLIVTVLAALGGLLSVSRETGHSGPETAPAGWYPDPDGGPSPRWWDGQQWVDV